jgi:threonyl-tRNA synthetase
LRHIHDLSARFRKPERQEWSMVRITLPDGSVRQYEGPVTAEAVAAEIGPRLAKDALVARVDGRLVDLRLPIEADAALEIVTRRADEALEILRHDCAHVLAEAAKELWPEIQVTIGPAIEDGFYYDFSRATPFTPEDLEVMEARMREIVTRDEEISREVWSREQAIDYFQSIGELYKAEIIGDFAGGEVITVYRQGDFIDLCRGPHLRSTGQLGDAFKLMKVAGAYWRGDHRNEMLQRVYGTCWRDRKELDDYLHRLEEAERRDHRRIGREMNLFHFQEEAPGAVFWHAKGWAVFQQIIAYMRRRLRGDYDEVNAPQLVDKSLWETSGHWNWYRENMFKVQSAGDDTGDERVFALKPMNCPGHIQIFKHGLKSYRDLPYRIAEFGIVHRYEFSGALHGLMRVRAFTQDDAHIFCTEEQMAEECHKINELVLTTYADFGFEEVEVRLSTRPEHRVGSDQAWDRAEAIMKQVLGEIAAHSGNRIKTGINPGDGAFYGPKFDYILRDAIGRDWQCGTTQVDFNLPERFGATYVDTDGERRTPVMIHRAICGSMERFLGILLENYAGRFPLWLAPVQVVIATITSDGDAWAAKVARRMQDAGLRAELDLRNEKINYKVREHSLAKVPAIIAIGRREAEDGTVSLRRLGAKGQEILALDDALAKLTEEARAPDL